MKQWLSGAMLCIVGIVACLLVIGCSSRRDDKAHVAEEAVANSESDNAGDAAREDGSRSFKRGVLSVRYSERIWKDLYFDSGGNLVLDTSGGSADLVIRGTVKAVKNLGIIRSPSVAADNRQAVVELDKPELIFPYEGVKTISLRYDEYALLGSPIEVGDRLEFTFTDKGMLCNVKHVLEQ